jgi:nitrite reductase/ring-hydroxylating ferredoxin subunit
MSFGVHSNWYKIAESLAEIDFSADGLTQITASGKVITVGLHQNKLFACAGKCPHAGGLLADGYIDESGNLVCPLHRYRFNPYNGRNISGEGFFLKTFAIEQRPDGIFINIPGI